MPDLDLAEIEWSEKLLGPAPITITGKALGATGMWTDRQVARRWLRARGVLPIVADRAKDFQLAAAYNDFHQRRGRYLQKMLADDGTGRPSANRYQDFSATGAAIFGPDDIPADEPEPMPAQAVIDTLRSAATSGTSQLDAIIDKAADAVIAGRLGALKSDLQGHIRETVAKTKLELSPEAKQAIRDLAAEEARTTTAALLPPRRIEVQPAPDRPAIDLGLQHERFPLLLRALSARDHRGFRLNIWLTGPTGSGKTTAAENVAKALEPTFTQYAKVDGRWEIRDEHGALAALNGLSHDSPFGADSSLDADYKVVGFKDATGTFHWTTFLRIFAFGGIYVADEIDNWLPSALVALNAALANGWISTPIGIIRRHPDCAIIAAANTWGLGATSEYVGRSKLDAATINRFPTKIDWPVDEKLESAIARELGGEDWCQAVQTARARARAQGLHVIFSPRNTFDGIALLRQGFPWTDVVAMNLAAGLKPEQVEALRLDALRVQGPPSAQNVNAPIAEPITPIAEMAWKEFQAAADKNIRWQAAQRFQQYHNCNMNEADRFAERWIAGLLPPTRETFFTGKPIL